MDNFDEAQWMKDGIRLMIKQARLGHFDDKSKEVLLRRLEWMIGDREEWATRSNLDEQN